jgi:transposase
VGALKRRARYPSDPSDKQWELIEPLLPPVNTDGWPEKHSRRAIVDAILYVVRTGCAWRQLPADFPPWHGVLVLQRAHPPRGGRCTSPRIVAAGATDQAHHGHRPRDVRTRDEPAERRGLRRSRLEPTGDPSVLTRLGGVLDLGDKNFAIVTPD